MKKYYFLRKATCHFLISVVIFLGGLQYTKANEIIVSAAISLSNVFKEIATLYEDKYPTDKVLFNFGASGSLLQQIDQGAPVDIFASADQKTMDQASKKGLIIEQSRKDFAYNSLVLIAPSHSHLYIQNLEGLLQSSIQQIAVGQSKIVPAGRYTQDLLQQNNLWDKLQHKLIIGQNVRQVLDYVARNEVNIGFVYHSDAVISPNKVKILLNFPLNNSICYPIALIKRRNKNKNSENFINFVLSPDGQHILKKYGFSSVSY